MASKSYTLIMIAGLLSAGHLYAQDNETGCPDDRPHKAFQCNIEQTFMKPITCCLERPSVYDQGTPTWKPGSSQQTLPPDFEARIMTLQSDSGSRVQVTK